MANAEARRTMPGPLEVVEIERSFLREVGSVFWFIVNTFEETLERVQQGRVPFRAASFFRHTQRAGVDSVPLGGLVCFFLGANHGASHRLSIATLWNRTVDSWTGRDRLYARARAAAHRHHVGSS